MNKDRFTQILYTLDKLVNTLDQPVLKFIHDTVRAEVGDYDPQMRGDAVAPLIVASQIIELDVALSYVQLDPETRRALRGLITDLRIQAGLPPDTEKLPRLFVSYAHADDSRFVQRLVANLVEAGFEVWWDQTYLPSRGVSLPQELRDAILTQSDWLLAIVGPQSAKKGITEGTNIHLEWQTARQFCKVTVPILRGCSVDLLPESLRGPLYFDFNDDAEYESKLAELLGKLKIAENPPGKLSKVPDLPAHYLERLGDLKHVKSMLLGKPELPVVVSGQHKKINIQGMGGIGKSIIAQALAHDCDIRRAFADGVYWIRLGENPNLLARQSDLAESISGFQPDIRDIESGKAKLSELLSNRACLIILDDVWDKEHFLAFDVLGPRCRTLCTDPIKLDRKGWLVN